MKKLILIFLLILGTQAWAKTPVGFKKWQIDDTTFVKNVGGTMRNYQKPDKVWAGIVNDFELDGDSVVYVDKAVLRPRVNRNGTSSVSLTWGGNEYTVTQKMLGVGWLKISTRQSQWIDSTMNWNNFSVDSNIAKWTAVSPGVDYRVLKGNGRVAHGIFYKPAFLDSAVTLYNQRPDSLDIALANVMVYTLSANIDDADSAIGDVPKRRLKDFGEYSFNLRHQQLRFPGYDTLPQVPVRQYWERRGAKIICIEYIMMSKVERVHQAYPNSVIWHNDTKNIEGAANVEDAELESNYPDHNTGAAVEIFVQQEATAFSIVIRVLNVSTELGADVTISACRLAVYNEYNYTDGNIGAYRIFKPWVQGDELWQDNDDGDVTYNDWASDANEWTTEGCLCANDDGVDNNVDGGACDASSNRDRKATEEDMVDVTTSTTWYFWDIASALAQAWYAGTANENGVLLYHVDSGTKNKFSSIENAESGEWPYWEFTYTTGAPAAGRRERVAKLYQR